MPCPSFTSREAQLKLQFVPDLNIQGTEEDNLKKIGSKIASLSLQHQPGREITPYHLPILCNPEKLEKLLTQRGKEMKKDANSSAKYPISVEEYTVRGNTVGIPKESNRVQVEKDYEYGYY